MGSPPNVFADVAEFHEQVVRGQIATAPRFPAWWVQQLRLKLVREETAEFLTALEAEDFEGMLDGACDVLVVVLGTLHAYGLPFNEAWREVHRTNMAKKDGPVREDGKVLKPEGWQPPDIHRIVNEAIARGRRRRD